MKTNAVNLINFKSHYANNEANYDYEDIGFYNQAIDTVSEAQDKFVASSDIKKIGPLAMAITALFAKLGLKGAATTLLIDQTTKNKASKAVDGYLKQGIKKAQEIGEHMTVEKPKGLLKKAQNTIGESIKNTSEQVGKFIVKNGAVKNLSLLGAAASIIAFAPRALTADNNRDGISDIAQYSQVYDDSAAELDKLQEKASIIGKCIALFA